MPMRQKLLDVSTRLNADVIQRLKKGPAIVVAIKCGDIGDENLYWIARFASVT